MTAPTAILPMYDWPEVRTATDALWSRLRDAFRAEGFEAPDELDRSASLTDAIADGTLLLGQTCGLPYVQDLRQVVTLLGAPDYGVPGCAPGEYRSAIVCHVDDPREALSDFKGSCFSMSAPHSQSGFAAMLHELVPLADGEPFFAKTVASGGHVNSIELLASGGADLAAIDYVSLRLARQFMPAALHLREIKLTTPSPGLPLVAARDCDKELMQEIIESVMGSLDKIITQALGIKSFIPYLPDDYDIIAGRFRAAAHVANPAP